MKPILILTDPIPIGKYLFIEKLKSLLRSVKRFYKPLPKYMDRKFRGHFAVTRSLVEGVAKLKIPCLYNPRNISSADVVIVLSNVVALRQCIDLKKRGLFKRVIAGPNLVVFPNEAEKVLLSSEIDTCIVPSDFIRDLYVDIAPDLKGRCISWPAGVDVDFWKPKQQKKTTKKVLVYLKSYSESDSIVVNCCAYISLYGFEIIFIKYGEYIQEQYLNMLRQVDFVVGFTNSESQGIAWAEAWSVDVPTFIFRVKSTVYQGIKFECSSAPYLTEFSGEFFDDAKELGECIGRWIHGDVVFSPRKWVLNNMSDEVCARKMLEIISLHK